MPQFKVGDIVARRSYNYDVLFKIKNIRSDMADLVGITVRIVADAPIYDLKYIPPEESNKILKKSKKGIDKPKGLWYNKDSQGAVAQESRRVHTSTSRGRKPLEYAW